MRASVEVRHASAADLPEVARLCLVARDETATPSQICQSDTSKLQRQLGVLLSVPGGRIYVASDDSTVVGFMLARIVESNVYNDEPVLYIEGIYVDETSRRRGVGHALLTAAAQTAVEAGADEVYSVPIPGSRAVQRFLARMGFAPAAAHRVVSTTQLLRKLGAESPVGRRGPRGLEDLIARRRKARIETQSGPVDLRELRGRLAARGVASLEDAPSDAAPLKRLV